MPTRQAQTRLLFISLAAVCSGFQSVHALVTSDGGPTGGGRIALAGDSALTFGLAHEGVGLMSVTFDDSPTPGIATATLLAAGGGRFAITAAHTVADGVGFSVVSAKVDFELPGGVISRTALASAGQIHLHPDFTGDVLAGNDIAILEFPFPLPMAVPRYDLFTTPGGAELEREIVMVGYGKSGFGATGTSALPGLAEGTKRAGLNRWESLGLGALGAPDFADNASQLTADFDSGAVANDAFSYFFGTTGPMSAGDPMFDGDLGYGPEEVGVAVGDSGGPGFVFPDGESSDFRIAGVASYTTRLSVTPGGLATEDPAGASSDITGSVNSSWGEFMGHARVADPDNLAFILSVVAPLPADFDDDGDVDLIDYGIWSGAYGASAAGDANGDGVSDAADYTLWRDQLGSGPTLPAVAVPEPVSQLAALALAVALRRRGRVV